MIHLMVFVQLTCCVKDSMLSLEKSLENFFQELYWQSFIYLAVILLGNKYSMLFIEQI